MTSDDEVRQAEKAEKTLTHLPIKVKQVFRCSVTAGLRQAKRRYVFTFKASYAAPGFTAFIQLSSFRHFRK